MCTRPIAIKYIDRVRGGYSTQLVPCGHCIDCLHDKQDEWATRIQHECAHSKGFIFDTFTYRDSTVPCLDATCLEDSVLSKMSEESFEYLEKNDWLVKYPSYLDIRDHIKRGRELYYKRNGVRLKFKYFICSEYGDKKTKNYRPHFHLLAFGIDRATWVEYFAEPWYKRYGFTYTKQIDFTDKKHVLNVARYVGKYCSKGFFDIPLVKDGIAPKPFRLCSHGLGVDYLDTLRKEMSVFEKYVAELSFIPDNNRSYYTSLCTDNKYHDLLRLFRDKEVFDIMRFTDTNGYFHKLPRYYKNKLFGVEPSVFKTCFSAWIQARQKRLRYQLLLQYARCSGYKTFRRDWINQLRGVVSPRLCSFIDRFDNSEECKKRLASARRYDKIKVFYQ